MVTVSEAVNQTLQTHVLTIATELDPGQLEPSWYTYDRYNTWLITAFREYSPYDRHLQIEVAHQLKTNYGILGVKCEECDLLNGSLMTAGSILPIRFYALAAQLGVIKATSCARSFAKNNIDKAIEFIEHFPTKAKTWEVNFHWPMSHEKALRIWQLMPKARIWAGVLPLQSVMFRPEALLFPDMGPMQSWVEALVATQRTFVLGLAVAGGQLRTRSQRYEWPGGWTVQIDWSQFRSEFIYMRAIAFFNIIRQLPLELLEVIVQHLLPEGEQEPWGAAPRRFTIGDHDLQWLKSVFFHDFLIRKSRIIIHHHDYCWPSR